MIDGVWHPEGDVKTKRGRFVRRETSFRNWVTRDGNPGPSGMGGFQATPGRYHLYVAYACPWAHRTLIMRKLKRLEKIVTVSVVHWFMGQDGWTFADGDGVIPDPVGGAAFLHRIYSRARPDYTGRVTVPVLWDKVTDALVNNESAEIIRMFNSAFDKWGEAKLDFYPEALRGEIDEINQQIYTTVNNGVYRCGFASTQAAYNEAFEALFAALDELEARLGRQRYLLGGQITEADWRLFPTLIRFDPVYNVHFKCSKRRLAEYPNLWNYTRELYQWPGVADTVNMFHIKAHYYASHESINPRRLVAKGPAIDFAAPHDRARMKAA